MVLIPRSAEAFNEASGSDEQKLLVFLIHYTRTLQLTASTFYTFLVFVQTYLKIC